MAGDVMLAAACGTYCADCEFHPEKCAGCGYIEGKPFWAVQYGSEYCALYNCAVNRSGLEHCAACRDFPCDIFLNLRDPHMTDEEAEASLAQRRRDLVRRREIGTPAWLEERETTAK